MRRHVSLASLFIAAMLLPLSGCQSTASATTEPASSAAPAGSPAAGTVSEAATPAMVKQDFAAWVADFRQQARADGVDAGTLAAAFDSVSYLPRVIELDRSQPEFTRQVWDYLDSAVSDARITQGRAKLAEQRKAIDAASERYGVPAEILVAIWGIESNYGGNFGSFSTIDALATLGYDGRRPDFARSQLMAALRILERGDISRERMRGSWAGAMGHTQFIPTSFEAYARDGDGDGRRDIWGSIADVMASTAYYLDKAGWQTGKSWGVEVRLPASFNYAQTELATRKPSQDWTAQGVTPMRGESLPEFSEASVIAPAGANGPAFLVGDNFRVIMRYNASTSYALAVGLLSNRITGQPGVVAQWPRDEPALSRTQVKQLQTRLNANGFKVGTPDGIIGPNTRSGLREFQRSIGVIPDGFATLDLLERLKR